ncbi:hypothetical protein [Cetobacterium sp.]
MIKEDNQEITQEVINDFLIFLESQEDYLDSGLGAFHTDNHSNW